MDINEIIAVASEQIFSEIGEGIHIVDSRGVTIIYNKAMAKIEGLEKNQVMGKYLKDVYPDWTVENSTLLSVIKTGKEIVKNEQKYLNYQGKKIRTENSTFPIINDGVVIAAVEISKDLTNVTEMSEQIIKLQQKLIKPSTGKKEIRSYRFENLIGKNKEYLEAVRVAKIASKSSSSVLIYGATGTGKELFAQSIHYGSGRNKKPFIGQNCAAMPETLLEGILFGTAKGSFTGATDRMGLFEQADGGTLFLDEINSMSLALQAKILRVLQENYIRRVGGAKDIPIDVRIIAATNENPVKLIEKRSLREDLYYRINVINVQIPDLNSRKDDIPLLVEHFIKIYNEILGKDVWMISDELKAIFQDYNWGGNIRELRNFIESAMNMVDDEHIITKNHLPSQISETLIEKKIIKRSSKFKGLNSYLEETEREIINDYYIANKKNISKTALALGVSRQNLQYKLKKYSIGKM